MRSAGRWPARPGCRPSAARCPWCLRWLAWPSRKPGGSPRPPHPAPPGNSADTTAIVSGAGRTDTNRSSRALLARRTAASGSAVIASRRAAAAARAGPIDGSDSASCSSRSRRSSGSSSADSGRPASPSTPRSRPGQEALAYAAGRRRARGPASAAWPQTPASTSRPGRSAPPRPCRRDVPAPRPRAGAPPVKRRTPPSLATARRRLRPSRVPVRRSGRCWRRRQPPRGPTGAGRRPPAASRRPRRRMSLC